MAQAQTNPFLQSPYAQVGLDDPNAVLPGQQATQPAPALPEMAAAPVSAPSQPPVAAPISTPTITPAAKPTEDLLPPAALRPIFEASAREFNVPVNVLMALGQQESRYKADAIGQPTKYGRAKGMLQYLDDTAKKLGINAFDPAEAIPAAAKQLRERLDKGESMIDAVRGHFAGPDRAQWGPNTSAYGDEVLAKAGQIGDSLYGAAPQDNQPAPADAARAALQAQLDAEEPGRYRALSEVEAADLRGQQDKAVANQFSTALPREQYERMFRSMNKGATDAAIAQVMADYDRQAAARTQAGATKVEDRFATLRSPEAMFEQRLNAKLQAKSKGGVVPALPASSTVAPKDLAIIDPGAADRETGFDAMANFLGKSTHAGLYDLAGAGARLLDAVNPFTLSESDAATLYKDNPAHLKELQDNAATFVLSRFANRMAQNSDETMAQLSARAKRDYGNLEYATLDPEKAAYLSPAKVIGDTVRSLPSTVAMGLAVYLTRGAALQAERQALAAGLSQDMARQAAIQAGAKAMANVGAVSEGAVGYGQQVNQATQELAKLPQAELNKSPQYQALLREGYTPETARAQLIADTAQQAGRLAGIADAAVNKVGGEFLGRILSEGGKLLPRILKGAANEALTETTQSALEQLGQNFALQQNINPQQSLGQGVGEAAAAGAVMGGLMGGVAAGAGGTSNTPSAEQQVADAIAQRTAKLQANPQEIDAAARAALDPNQGTVAPEATRMAPLPTPPSQAPGMLTRALEDAATPQQNRVTATLPDGQQASGQLTGYQEDADGNFVAQILGDDGQVRKVDSARGIQLVPDAAPASPLSGALESAAAEHAATQPAAPQNAPQNIPEIIPEAMPAPVLGTQAAPEPVVVPERPVEVPLASMDLPALQERLQYIQEQAKRSGGMTRPMVDARNAVQREIKQRKQEAARATVPTENAMERPAGDALSAPAGTAEPAQRAPLPELGTESAPGTTAAGPVADRGPVPAGAGTAADQQPALTGYTSDLAARQARKDLGMGKTHQVIERAPSQFDIVPQAAKVAKAKPAPKQAPRRASDKLVAAEAKTARQEAAIAQAQESAAQRAKAADDVTYRNAVEIVQNTGKASVALVQRHLNSSYEVAEAQMQRMERDGIVSPAASNGKRELLQKSSEPEFGTEAYWQARADEAMQTRSTAAPTQGASNEARQETVPTRAEKTSARPAKPARPKADVLMPKQEPRRKMDHGELNIPGRTSTIDAELDRYKADQTKQQKQTAKTAAQQTREDKARAKELFAEVGEDLVVQHGDKFGEKALRKELDSMVKWEPKKFIAMAEKFKQEQVLKKEPALSVTGNDTAATVQRVLADKTDATVNVPGLGNVTIPYGDAKSGLAHIAKRRGQAFLPRVADLLAHGKVFTKAGQEGRVFLGHGADEAVISLQRDGKDGPWLLSAYEKYPDLKEAKRSEVAEDAMPEGQFFTKDDLQVNLSKQGVLGQVIASMIDAGVIVLHGGPNKLPQGIGRRVKGVQAVTLPDGTIHMVASNLTPQTALPVLLHEMFHEGGEALIGSKEWGNLLGRLGSLYRQSDASSGKARAFFDRARARVDAARKKGAIARPMEVEEFAAYAIEEYEKDPRNLPQAVRKWVEDLIGMVQTWAVQRFGKQLGAVTPAQLAAMARLALMDHAATRRGQIFGPIGEAFSQPAAPTAGMTSTAVESAIAALRQKWQGFTRITVVQSVDDLPPDLAKKAQAAGGVEGVYDPASQQVYLVADHLESPERAAFVAAHEVVGHGGLRLLHDRTVTDALRHAAGNTLVKRLAVAIQDDRGDVAPHVAVEEAIAELSAALETGDYAGLEQRYGITIPESAKSGLRASIARLLATLKRFIANITQQPVERVSDAQVRALLRQQQAAVEGRSAQETAPEMSGEPAFSVTADDLAELAGEEAQAKGLTPAAQGKLRRFQAVIQDNMNRVKQVQERIGQVTGDADLGRADYYGAETVRPGRIAARLDDFRTTLLAPLVEQVAKEGYTPDQLAELLHAQHAEERNAAVARINPEHDPASDAYTGTQGSGMNDVDAQRILAQYADQPKLLALAQRARTIAKATLDLKLAYGLIKPADHELLTTQYQNYVPLKGDGEYGPKIKRATGHGAREEHILENIARDYEQTTVAGEKNLARQSLLQMVLKYPDDQLWTARVPPRGKTVAGKSYSVQRNGKSEAVFGSLSQVNAFLEAKGAEAASYEVLDSAGERVVEFTKPLQDNEVIVYVNGDPVRLQFHDEALARQLRPLDGGQLNPILEVMRKVNRYLSGIYTGYNPAFIFKNAVRDAVTGTLNITANQGAGVAGKAWTKYLDALAAMGQWAATRQAPSRGMGRWLEEYRQQGGKTGASWMSDLEAQGKTIQATFDDARGLLETAKTDGAKRAAAVAWRQSVGKLAHAIEIGNQAAENALRLALYATLREQGQSPTRAAQAAKSVTVDFDRKGSQTAALGALYLFLNPAIQGTANAFKAMAKGEHKAQGWAALGGLASLGALAAAQGMDDDKDRWLGQTWEDRTKNLLLNVGGHQLKLPLSQEFAPFYAAGVAGAEALRGENPLRSAARLFSSFVDAYFPFKGAFNADSENRLADVAQAAVPTLVKPLVESGFNRNSFGSQIVPENPQTKDRADNQKMFRATKGTAYDTAAQTIAKLGEATGAGKYENDWSKVSPETLKYLWRTYTGGLGAFITDSAGAARIAMADPGSLDTGDIPVLKDFVKENNQKPLANRYRELAREASAAITEYKQIKKAGDGEAAELFSENGHKLALAGMSKLIERVNKAAAALADRKVDINSDSTLSLAEKRAQLKAIEAEEEALYRGAIGAFTQ